MMGRAHSLSGAAIWLGGTSAYTLVTGTPIEPAIVIMGTAIVAGGALAPDLDSYTATVTKSFGIFGRILYYITNTVSILMYNLTKTRKDDDISNGHRTFMHTLVAAILVGLGVYALTSLPGTLPFFGETIAVSELSAVILMGFFLHLGLAGLLAPQLKKAKKQFGPYLLMLASVLVTFMFSRFVLIPAQIENYHWLAYTIAGGLVIHIFGDTITKMGTPFLWPLKIRGKRWYDISLPSAFRITAGGAVEMKILTPLFILTILLGASANILLAFNLI